MERGGEILKEDLLEGRWDRGMSLPGEGCELKEEKKSWREMEEIQRGEGAGM